MDTDKKKEIQKELETKEVYQPYFAQYSAGFKERFIQFYSTHKLDFMQENEAYEIATENRQVYWMNLAYSQLKLIQQKKLFDLQCQWRADKIEIEGVEIIDEIKQWETDIMHCPFLEPVSEEDVELFKQFLQTNNTDIGNIFFNYGLQNYEVIKAAYQSENETANFPEYYEFHNGRTGNSVFMSLPDLAGEREDYLYDVYERKIKLEREELLKKPGYTVFKADPKQYSSNPLFVDATFDEFIRSYETKTMKAAYKLQQEELENLGTNLEFTFLMDAIYKLFDDEANVPFENDVNWKEAIFKTDRKHACKKLIEYLDIAFAEYQLKEQVGLLDAPKHHHDMKEDIEETKQIFKEAREWLDEGNE